MAARRRKLSVGLVVFNGERYLAEAIDSILAQTFENFELILSDNASTDATADICQAYAAADRRVRYLRNAVNVGVAENFNLAFRAANSDYFRWAAHDDRMAPTYLQRCVAMLDADPALAAAHSLARAIDENGNVFRLEPQPLLLQSPFASERYRAIVTGREYAFWSVIRSDVITRVLPHKPHPSSEYIFQAEVALRGSFGIVPERLFDERWHADRYSQSAVSADQLRQWWGNSAAQNVWLQAPARFYGQATAVWRSPASWEQKILCWRHLSGCVEEYFGDIAARNRRRLHSAAVSVANRLRRTAVSPRTQKDQYDASIQ
jgi:glycosyltransferase involved in cell wall biosynthesis